MIFRKAELKDLPELKVFFSSVANDLNNRDIHIWNDVFPFSCLDEDINKKRLFVLVENERIISVFALVDSDDDMDKHNLCWEKSESCGCYLYRLAVSIDCYKKGIGSLMLKYAQNLAKEKGAEFLRLYVADCNYPAISFYEKNDYSRARGVIEKDIFDFKLYGYEKKVF